MTIDAGSLSVCLSYVGVGVRMRVSVVCPLLYARLSHVDYLSDSNRWA